MLMPPESQANNALEVENLHKSFGANHVLKGISMGTKNGEVWSIIGSSGSGKSTFLRCLNLLELCNDSQWCNHFTDIINVSFNYC